MALGIFAATPFAAFAAGPPANPDPLGEWRFDLADEDGSGSYNGGTWDWVQSIKTLTLTDIDFSTSARAGLALPADSTLEIIGTNTIATTYSGGAAPDGIFVYSGNLNITGRGSLTATAAKGSTGFGILVRTGDLNISGGTVTAIGSDRAIAKFYTVPIGFVADLLNLFNVIQIYSNMNNFEYADVFDKQAIS